MQGQRVFCGSSFSHYFFLLDFVCEGATIVEYLEAHKKWTPWKMIGMMERVGEIGGGAGSGASKEYGHTVS